MFDFHSQPIRNVVLRVPLQRSLGPHILEQYILGERIETFWVNVIGNNRTYDVHFLRLDSNKVKITIYSSRHEVYWVFDSVTNLWAVNILKHMTRDFTSFVEKYSFNFFHEQK